MGTRNEINNNTKQTISICIVITRRRKENVNKIKVLWKKANTKQSPVHNTDV